MYTTTNKNRIVIYAVCALAFILAGFFQAYDSLLPEFWHALFALLAHTILISLVVVWGVSLIHRMVRKDLLVFFLTISILILFFLTIRMIKYGLTEEIDTLSRYLWYSYYVPQCLTPPTLFLAVISIEKKNGKPLKKLWYLLYVPAILLIALVYTNDLHECFFKLYFENGKFSYKHQFLFYLALCWEIFITFASIIVMFVKCGISVCKKKVWLPLGTFAICVMTSTVCFLINTKAFKIPELLCFTCITLIESCILIGLIPSNDRYENYFYHSGYSPLITNDNFEIIYRSANSVGFGKETLKKASIKPILIDKKIRLTAEKIHGGYVFRSEDLSKINEINEALKETSERLADENYLIEAENEIKEQKTQIAEQNKLYAKIESSTNSELERLEKLLLETKNKTLDDDAFIKNFRFACVLASYIKRRSNLVMLTEKNSFLDAFELSLSFKELLDYLSLAGVECSLDFTLSGNIESETAKVFYDFFERVIVCDNDLPYAVIVHVYKTAKNITMLIESDNMCDVNNEEVRLKEKFVKYAAYINVKTDDEAIYYCLSLPLGGSICDL